MALKGKAKIELVNADGTKEVVEHGNMITDAVADLVYASRGEQSNIMRIEDRGISYAEALFGGILLFKHTLSSDPADYYIPSVKTAGYAANIAYSGEDIERGGFNTVESGLQADGSYKLVWDFATSQANGVIQSIGLCPAMMGRTGMSNYAVYSERIDATTKRPRLDPFEYNNYLDSTYGYNIVAVVGEVAYAIHADEIKGEVLKSNGGVLKIHKFDIASESVTLKSLLAWSRYLGSVDVQLPSDFVSSIASGSEAVSYCFSKEKNVLSLFRCAPNGDIAKNGTSKYAEIDFSNNMEVTSKTFTNNANGSIVFKAPKPAWHSYGAYAPYHVLGDYIVTVVKLDSDERKMYVTSKSDNTDIKEVKWENGNEFTVPTDSYNIDNIRLIFAFGNLFVFGTSQGDNYSELLHAYVLDLANGLVKKINAKNMTYRSNVELSNKVTWGKTGYNLGLSISVNPFVLTTKNNLDAPVTKTASQTMKITYTLTEVQ